VGQTGSLCTLKHDERELHTAQSRDKTFSRVVGLTFHRNTTVTKGVQLRYAAQNNTVTPMIITIQDAS